MPHHTDPTGRDGLDLTGTWTLLYLTVPAGGRRALLVTTTHHPFCVTRAQAMRRLHTSKSWITQGTPVSNSLPSFPFYPDRSKTVEATFRQTGLRDGMLKGPTLSPRLNTQAHRGPTSIQPHALTYRLPTYQKRKNATCGLTSSRSPFKNNLQAMPPCRRSLLCYPALCSLAVYPIKFSFDSFLLPQVNSLAACAQASTRSSPHIWGRP